MTASLYDVLAPGTHVKITGFDRDAWKSVVGVGVLQDNCNRVGFNMRGDEPSHARARVGIVSNNENDCFNPDSFIGIGGGFYQVYAGNGATFVATGNVFYPSWAYIMVS
eukprot:m.13426 g.13426  ORF g.13426 m.13426 type:complete len:109 (-) comp19881_c0_seq1:113-439(-)